uniref:Uncharacterized protein n=1 Tax=Cacopsylla melanoneura TaxID=428564 RepID=A0A8D8TY54_9HEMI
MISQTTSRSKKLFIRHKNSNHQDPLRVTKWKITPSEVDKNNTVSLPLLLCFPLPFPSPLIPPSSLPYALLFFLILPFLSFSFLFPSPLFYYSPSISSLPLPSSSFPSPLFY